MGVKIFETSDSVLDPATEGCPPLEVDHGRQASLQVQVLVQLQVQVLVYQSLIKGFYFEINQGMHWKILIVHM